VDTATWAQIGKRQCRRLHSTTSWTTASFEPLQLRHRRALRGGAGVPVVRWSCPALTDTAIRVPMAPDLLLL
jgi:hypothetical protein